MKNDTITTHTADTKMIKRKWKKMKKSEFSQRLVVVSWIVTIIWISLSFILAFLGKDTNSTVTVTLVTETFGTTLAYFIYQATLKISRNKYGIDEDGVPFGIKHKLNNSINNMGVSSNIENDDIGGVG